MTLLLKQATILDPQSTWHQRTVDIFIEDGIIKDIAEEINNSADQFVQEKDLCVSPGFVDVYADYRDPGHEQHETLESGTKTAAAGGFTHVFLAPNTSPVLDNKGSINQLKNYPTNSPTTLYPIGAASKNAEGKVLAEMMDMQQAGAVCFSDGWQPLQNSNLLLKALEYVKSFEGIILQIPIEESLSSGAVMNEGSVSTQLGLPGMPEVAEEIAVHKLLALLANTKSRLHISGISTARSVQMIAEAKAEGQDVTCAVTPYHLSFTDDMLKGYDSVYKVNPPLRTEADRQALVAGLKSGVIDCIASHHYPQDWDAKQKELDYAAFGMNVQQHTFQMVYAALKDTVTIERILDAMGTRARGIFSLPAATIVSQMPADLVLYSLTENTEVREDQLLSLSRNHPLLNTTLAAKIFGTVLGNRQSIVASA